jgi:GDPmannose 4,6-dehydratase
MKIALITGITGQDGRHLAKLLLSKNYKVFGMVNRQRDDLANLLENELPDVIQVRGDLADSASLNHVISDTDPDEVYNLGAISFVGMSFKQPELTCNITGLGVVRLLEAIRTSGKPEHTRFYQASSSEMFGKVQQVPQSEDTPFYPRSPYGVAKVMAHQACVNYREAYNMHISCGILFNHEGEKRGYEFVTRKITQAVAQIYLGITNELRLGNLDTKRDWGYAGDYVDAMWRMVQQEVPSDYVIATGETHSVREFLEEAFRVVGITDGIDKYVKIDSKFMRPSEVDLLVGDASKARNHLHWKSTTDFKQLVKLMVDNDLRIEMNKAAR